MFMQQQTQLQENMHPIFPDFSWFQCITTGYFSHIPSVAYIVQENDKFTSIYVFYSPDYLK